MTELDNQSAALRRRAFLTVVLEGGLGNRMRVAASAASLGRSLGRSVRVVWLEQWGLRCRFDQLFRPADVAQEGGADFELRDGTFSDKLLLSRPQRRNFHVPKYLQRAAFRDVVFSTEVSPRLNAGFDFRAWAAQGNCLIHSYRDFFPWDVDWLQRLFRPLPSIEERVAERCAGFSEHTVGVHIRRTDHSDSRSRSPLEAFFAVVDAEVAQRADTCIYLATDDEPTKAAMRERYPGRVVASPDVADCESREGVADGLVDMLALSRAHRIYGSANSTFSEMAAALSGKPFSVVQRADAPPPASMLWTTRPLASLP